MILRAFGPVILIGCGALCASPSNKIVIDRAVISQSEDGPAALVDEKFVPGETIYFSVSISGYAVHEREEQRSIMFSYSMDAKDPTGTLLVPTEAGKVVTDVEKEDKNWMPRVRWSFVVPPIAVSGICHISITINDELGKSTATREISFAVAGHAIELSDKLAIRNVRFLRDENDRVPLTVAAYRPGDTLWVRFDMTGYQLGEKNKLDVEYGISILRANGESMYAQPHAAVEEGASFYPKRYIPGMFSINIPKDLKAAGYVLVVSVEDRIGKQSQQGRWNFQVE